MEKLPTDGQRNFFVPSPVKIVLEKTESEKISVVSVSDKLIPAGIISMTGEKPHACSYCFARKCNLMRHMQVHKVKSQKMGIEELNFELKEDFLVSNAHLCGK